uniref:Fibrinogen C-terminal domain-containing protein n=2 Tax=Bombyx TaxID=7090 RepID=A0A8R2M9G9_BOMMO|nr:fibrinogen C domain-containing protein 1-B isoform X2 [Bombyx mori]
MMISQYILIFFTLLYPTFAKKENIQKLQRIQAENEIYDFNKINFRDHFPSTTGRTAITDAVVEKFVETLMASEKYLKMIETIERKLNHLDTTINERMKGINKSLSEILKATKTTSVHFIEDSLKNLKFDLEKLKKTMRQRLEDNTVMRVSGTEYQTDPSLDTKLSVLESNTKSILSGVESILTVISEVKNRQYTKPLARSDMVHPSSREAISIISEFRKSLREHKTRKCDCRSERVDRSERYPTDCFEIQMQGFNVSGIYKIKPDDMDSFYVLCDLSTAGGGWTVFQNRFDGSQDFYKGWSDYVNGFGNLAGEFWLGLEKVSFLTNQKLYELRIELEAQNGPEVFASYSVFTVGPEEEGYRISTLGTYYGTAGDSLSYHAGQKFSTFDVDNDEWKDGSCAQEHGGAWWYKECDKSNLNGKYSTTTEENKGQSIYWISFKVPNYPLSKTKMMIRPLPAKRPTDFIDNSRKISDGSKKKPLPEKQSRVKDMKTKYDVKHNHPMYRYDEHTHSDAFFPNYA